LVKTNSLDYLVTHAFRSVDIGLLRYNHRNRSVGVGGASDRSGYRTTREDDG